MFVDKTVITVYSGTERRSRPELKAGDGSAGDGSAGDKKSGAGVDQKRLSSSTLVLIRQKKNIKRKYSE